jgi:CheY-like chemotaxis protein
MTREALLHGCTARVVDDDDDVRGVLRDFLVALGAAVHVAVNGLTGLEQLEH